MHPCQREHGQSDPISVAWRGVSQSTLTAGALIQLLGSMLCTDVLENALDAFRLLGTVYVVTWGAAACRVGR
jgi:hypothetical protein